MKRVSSTWKKSPGRPPAHAKEVATSEKILQVAADLFMAQGFESVTVDAVARECQVTKATVYYYYATKAALFTAAVIRLMDSIAQKTQAILDRDEPLQQRLLLIAKIRLMTGGTRLDFDMVLHEADLSLNEEQRQAMHDAEQELTNRIMRAFAEAIEKGQVKPLSAHFYALAYLTLLNSFHMRLFNELEKAVTADNLAVTMMDFFWSGAGISSSVV